MIVRTQSATQFIDYWNVELSLVNICSNMFWTFFYELGEVYNTANMINRFNFNLHRLSDQMKMFIRFLRQAAFYGYEALRYSQTASTIDLFFGWPAHFLCIVGSNLFDEAIQFPL